MDVEKFWHDAFGFEFQLGHCYDPELCLWENLSRFTFTWWNPLLYRLPSCHMEIISSFSFAHDLELCPATQVRMALWSCWTKSIAIWKCSVSESTTIVKGCLSFCSWFQWISLRCCWLSVSSSRWLITMWISTSVSASSCLTVSSQTLLWLINFSLGFVAFATDARSWSESSAEWNERENVWNVYKFATSELLWNKINHKLHWNYLKTLSGHRTCQQNILLELVRNCKYYSCLYFTGMLGAS